MNEDQAERVRLSAERLSQAERVLVNARKQYAKALRAWDAAAQVKLD
jgi:hypothetical protein